MQASVGAELHLSKLLEIRDAEVRRRGKAILHIDDFAMDEGESVAIVGPNGCGKSTFVGLLTRDVHPLHRDIPPVVFRGNPNMSLADTKKCTGYVAPALDLRLERHMLVIEYVIASLFGTLLIPKFVEVEDAQYDAAMAALEEIGADSLAYRDVQTLSTGQLRRVHIARALVHDPDILVLDEPTTGLDPEGMYLVRETMELLASSGRSIFLVTHYLEDIPPSVERVLMLKDGAVEADGKKEELLDQKAVSALFEIPIEVEERDGRYAMIFDYQENSSR